MIGTILALLLTLPAFSQNAMSRSSGSIKYRLLHSRPTDATKEAEYVASVDVPLGTPEIEGVICQIIEHEKPRDYRLLNISIYYALDEYIPSAGARALADKLSAHRI